MTEIPSEDSSPRYRAEIANDSDTDAPSSKEDQLAARGAIILAVLLATLVLAIWALYWMINAQRG